MPSKARKVTFSLHEEVLSALTQAVADGAAPSKNALVERALMMAIDVIRREERRKRWAKAARDPRFLRDIQDTEDAFATADIETARAIR